MPRVCIRRVNALWTDGKKATTRDKIFWSETRRDLESESVVALLLLVAGPLSHQLHIFTST